MHDVPSADPVERGPRDLVLPDPRAVATVHLHPDRAATTCGGLRVSDPGEYAHTLSTPRSLARATPLRQGPTSPDPTPTPSYPSPGPQLPHLTAPVTAPNPGPSHRARVLTYLGPNEASRFNGILAWFRANGKAQASKRGGPRPVTEAALADMMDAWEARQRVRVLSVANALRPEDRAGVELAGLYSRLGFSRLLPYPPVDLTVRHIFPTHRPSARARDILRLINAELLVPFEARSRVQLTLDGMAALRVPSYLYGAGPVLRDVTREVPG